MNRKQATAAAAPILVGLAPLLTSSPMSARESDERVPYTAEVQSCLATVNEHLGLDSARRVRHFVADANRTGNGYALTIETTVLFDNQAGAVEKHYEAFCVARGANEPSTFRIDEIGA